MSDTPSSWPGLEAIAPTPPGVLGDPPNAPPSLPPNRRSWAIFVVIPLAIALLVGSFFVTLRITRSDSATQAPPTPLSTLTPDTNSSNTPKASSTTPGTTSKTRPTGSNDSSVPSGDFHPAPVRWSSCSPRGYDCATVDVPLDYDHPNGRRISLALKRHRAVGATRTGSVFFNPGGPGGSGVNDLSLAVADMSDDVRQHFDIVGWDPRGVGLSAPIKCDEGGVNLYRQDLQGVHVSGAVVAAAKAWADECQARSGDLLPFVGTNDVARDLDVLREAVGDEKLTYFGVSYGTEIGLVYAQRFPKNIRAMIIDGVVDPTIDPFTANIEQSIAVDNAIKGFFDWCRSTSSCELHSDPSGALDQLNAAAAKGDLSGAVRGKDTVLSPSLASLAVIVATYDAKTWPILATAVAAALGGDTSALVDLINSYLGGVSLGDNAAVNCIDTPLPTAQQMDQLAEKSAQAAPRTGPFNANSGRMCEFWPTPAKPVPTTYTAEGSPTIMVWGTTGDNATPYKQAVHISTVLQNARLVTLDANRHAAIGANDCVKAAQSAYLLNLTLPAVGTRC